MRAFWYGLCLVEDVRILHSRGEGLLPTHLSSLWRLAFAKKPFGYCLGIPDWCCRQNRMGGHATRMCSRGKKKRPMSQQQLANVSAYPAVYAPAAQQWCQADITVGLCECSAQRKTLITCKCGPADVSSCKVSVLKLLFAHRLSSIQGLVRA